MAYARSLLIYLSSMQSLVLNRRAFLGTATVGFFSVHCQENDDSLLPKSAEQESATGFYLPVPFRADDEAEHQKQREIYRGQIRAYRGRQSLPVIGKERTEIDSNIPALTAVVPNKEVLRQKSSNALNGLPSLIRTCENKIREHQADLNLLARVARENRTTATLLQRVGEAVLLDAFDHNYRVEPCREPKITSKQDAERRLNSFLRVAHTLLVHDDNIGGFVKIARNLSFENSFKKRILLLEDENLPSEEQMGYSRSSAAHCAYAHLLRLSALALLKRDCGATSRSVAALVALLLDEDITVVLTPEERRELLGETYEAKPGGNLSVPAFIPIGWNVYLDSRSNFGSSSPAYLGESFLPFMAPELVFSALPDSFRPALPPATNFEPVSVT